MFRLLQQVIALCVSSLHISITIRTVSDNFIATITVQVLLAK